MKRTATAQWKGTNKEGVGTLNTQSGAIAAMPYTYKGRFVDESGKSGTNPEELIAAAHSACFSMQFSGVLTANGTPPAEINATAAVEIIQGTGITSSALTVTASVPGLDASKFAELAEKAKALCPVSRALGAINVTVDARLA
ncbi:MAG: OsmC family peroxiredoxin [Devosia sp.]